MVRARFLIDLKTLVSRFVFGALRLPSPVPHPPTCSPRPPRPPAERTMNMFPVVFESVSQAGSALKLSKLLTLCGLPGGGSRDRARRRKVFVCFSFAFFPQPAISSDEG